MSCCRRWPRRMRGQVDTGLPCLSQDWLACHQRASWPRGASHFSCFAKKSNQKKATPGIRLIPPVLATRGTRTNRPMARKSARGGLMVRVYDRALLRSSGRIHGDPVELILDRFAINQIESGRLATITGWKSTPSIRFVSTKPASASIDLSLSIEIA